MTYAIRCHGVVQLCEEWPATALLVLLSAFLATAFPTVVYAVDDPAVVRCVEDALATAQDDVTVGELRARCLRRLQSGAGPAEERPMTAREERNAQEAEVRRNLWGILPHRPNYVLLGAYNLYEPNEDPFRQQFPTENVDLDDVESQFQISLKFPLATDLFGNRADIYAAYTNRSFWQVYNDDISSPFRDTNHEPEVWVQFRNDSEILGFRNVQNSFGFVHQSNGRGGVLSRSWNRLYADFLFERGNFDISVKPWWRIPEEFADDDNPDITDFLGHGELRLSFKLYDHVFSVMARNQIESGFDQGAIEVGWNFPLGSYKHLKGYVQWFEGYGESLIDYNVNVNRIGVGVTLTGWK